MRFTGAWHEDDEVSYPRPSSDAAAAGNDVDVAAVVVVVGTSASMMMTAQHSSLLAPSPLTCVRKRCAERDTAIEENIRRRRRYRRSQRCILIFPPVDETRRSG